MNAASIVDVLLEEIDKEQKEADARKAEWLKSIQAHSWMEPIAAALRNGEIDVDGRVWHRDYGTQVRISKADSSPIPDAQIEAWERQLDKWLDDFIEETESEIARSLRAVYDDPHDEYIQNQLESDEYRFKRDGTRTEGRGIRFSKLSPEAKEKACEDFREEDGGRTANDDVDQDVENWKEDLASIGLDCEFKDWSIGGNGDYVKLSGSVNFRRLFNVMLGKVYSSTDHPVSEEITQEDLNALANQVEEGISGASWSLNHTPEELQVCVEKGFEAVKKSLHDLIHGGGRVGLRKSTGIHWNQMSHPLRPQIAAQVISLALSRSVQDDPDGVFAKIRAKTTALLANVLETGVVESLFMGAV